MPFLTQKILLLVEHMQEERGDSTVMQTSVILITKNQRIKITAKKIKKSRSLMSGTSSRLATPVLHALGTASKWMVCKETVKIEKIKNN